MNLASFQIKPVLRSHWEAVDLGTAIAKRWFLPMFLAWLIPAMLVLCLLLLLFPHIPWVAALVTWWLKPLFDRLPLFILSRKVFGEKVGAGVSFKSLLSMLGIGLFSALTWRRFDMQRSFGLAVVVLERQRGKARGRRADLLQRTCGNAAAWLTIVAVHIETFILWGIAALFWMLIPQGVEVDLVSWLTTESSTYDSIYYGLYALCASLVAPFYISSGFSLYLNRRVALEAWDIEIKFRQSVQQRAAKKSGSTLSKASLVSCLAMLCFSLCFLGVAQPSFAQDNSQTQSAEVTAGESQDSASYELTEVKESIIQILQSPPYVIEDTERRLQWKNIQDEDEIPDWLIRFAEWLESLGGGEASETTFNIAVLVELLLWFLVIALIALLIFNFRHHIKTFVGSFANTKSSISEFQRPEVIMGMEITEDSLPEDIPGESRALWQQGLFREALALLYRGSLYRMVYQRNLELSESHTEQECLHLVAARYEESLVTYFRQLTQSWQNLAYAHYALEQDQFERLNSGWSEVFIDAE